MSNCKYYNILKYKLYLFHILKASIINILNIYSLVYIGPYRIKHNYYDSFIFIWKKQNESHTIILPSPIIF